jgi:hypothetical protein
MSNRISADTRVYLSPLTMLSAKLKMVMTPKRITTVVRLALSCPISALSTKSRDNNGRYSDTPVLRRLNPSTRDSRRQYGVTSRIARRRSGSIIA